MKVLWCPNHEPTTEQITDLQGGEISYLKNIISKESWNNISNCPADANELKNLASLLISTMGLYDKVVLPIGSPAFMAILMQKLPSERPKILFSHTERKSVEEQQPDGSIKKTSIFNHVVYIEI